MAILWDKDLTTFIKRQPDGNQRIVVISLESKPKPICLINAYLPSRNGTDSKMKYKEALDILHEIIMKYMDTHTIILGGDMNGSLHRQPENDHDKLLKDFLSEMKLTTPRRYPVSPTFHHHDGKAKSQIDYFFVLETQIDETTSIQNVKNKGLQPLNTSDHTMISGEITLDQLKREKRHIPTQSTYKKPKWNKCDKLAYINRVEELIEEPPKRKTNSKMDMAIDVIHLTNVLHEAGATSIPHYAPNSTHTKTKGRIPWNYEIEEASKRSKEAFHKWKTAGRPKSDEDNLYNNMKTTKKKLRKLQRQAEARIKENKYNKIMESAEFNQDLFHKLIREQRATSSCYTDLIIVEGETLSEDKDILNGWRHHFQTLATPVESPSYSKAFGSMVDLECLLIEDIITNSANSLSPIDDESISKAINKLSSGKAPDHLGITAEHLKIGGNKITSFIKHLINAILKEQHIPSVLQSGLLTPVLKKNKDARYPGNYRGIAVTPIISKILEIILQEKIDPILSPSQSKLQRGFTAETSPINAGIQITEAINEASDKGHPVCIITLDAEKAFDKVDHQLLLRKLFHSGVKNEVWKLIKILQTQAETKVKWKGNLSDDFPSRQGIRQGAKLSPTLYKRYNNDLLQSLELHSAGAKIGTTFIGAPTVADDIALVAYDPVDLQCALNIVYQSTQLDKVTINSAKSDAVVLYADKKRDGQKWKIGDATIDEVEETTHIGINRNWRNKNDVDNRIQKGRRTLYSLIGAGLHGKNGISPTVSHKIYTTFSRPRITYGLEAVTLLQMEKDKLEKFERKFLKQIQGLPDKCATVATYALLGTIPITAQIEKNVLTTFFNIARQPECIEHELACRQLAIKDESSNSWFTYVRCLLQKYELPTAYEIMECPPSKIKWKTILNNAFNDHWGNKWTTEKDEKSSLKYLTLKKDAASHPHNIWKYTKNNTRDVMKATVKARIITGTYTLQSHRHKFNQHEISDTCLLCKTHSEDTAHFILKCSALHTIRKKHLQTLWQILVKQENLEVARTICDDENLLLQCLLDCSNPCVMDLFSADTKIVPHIEEISRNMIFDLHNTRAMKLN